MLLIPSPLEFPGTFPCTSNCLHRSLMPMLHLRRVRDFLALIGVWIDGFDSKLLLLLLQLPPDDAMFKFAHSSIFNEARSTGIPDANSRCCLLVNTGKSFPQSVPRNTDFLTSVVCFAVGLSRESMNGQPDGTSSLFFPVDRDSLRFLLLLLIADLRES